MYAIPASFRPVTHPSPGYARALGYGVLVFLIVAAPAVCAPSDAPATRDAGALLHEAELNLTSGNPDRAAVMLYDMVEWLTEPADRVRALYNLAEAVGQLGRAGEKKHYLMQASELDPAVQYGASVRYEYCRILLESGDHDTCIAQARAFVELYRQSPLVPEVMFMEGSAFLARGEYQRAFNSFNTVTKSWPGTDAAREAVMKEGECLFKLELNTGAIERLEEYIATSPNGDNMAWALYYTGRARERNSQPAAAAFAFRRLVLEYPSFPDVMEAHYRLGVNLFDSGEFLDAENAFINYTLNSTPSDELYYEALYYLERLKFRTGRYGSETDIAEQYAGKYPDSPKTPDLLFTLAHFYTMNGQGQRAIAIYRRLMTDGHFTAFADSAAFMLADYHVRENEREKAIAMLVDRIRDNPGSRTAQAASFRLGSLHESWDRHEEALVWYDNARLLNESSDLSVMALWGMGRCLVRLNRWRDAEKTFAAILNDYPDTPYLTGVARSLADLYFVEGRLQESVLAAERAARFSDGVEKTDIQLFMAGIYEELDAPHALNLYSTISRNNRARPDQRFTALMRIGDLAMRRKDRNLARNAFSRIISEEADTSYVRQAREKLDALHTGMP